VNKVVEVSFGLVRRRGRILDAGRAEVAQFLFQLLDAVLSAVLAQAFGRRRALSLRLQRRRLSQPLRRNAPTQPLDLSVPHRQLPRQFFILARQLRIPPTKLRHFRHQPLTLDIVFKWASPRSWRISQSTRVSSHAQFLHNGRLHSTLTRNCVRVGQTEPRPSRQQLATVIRSLHRHLVKPQTPIQVFRRGDIRSRGFDESGIALNTTVPCPSVTFAHECITTVDHTAGKSLSAVAAFGIHSRNVPSWNAGSARVACW
jgi:hypothetical protein